MRILQTLLEISIYATILFGITMLLKRLLKDKLSPFLHYAIWSLFLLRLLLPVTLWLVLTFVLPTFIGIFQSMNVELPLLTRWLIAVSDFLTRHWLALLVLTFAGVLLFVLLSKSHGPRVSS